MDDILASIIVTSWNLKDLTLRALNSIPGRKDIEVIVVDDGSTDGTYEAVKEWKSIIPFQDHIHIFRNKTNKGFGAAMNVGLDNAHGKYIYTLDCDDYLYSEEFNRCLDFLDGTDMVYISGRLNSGEIIRTAPDIKYINCALWFKFIRREFLGDHRMLENEVTPDWALNKELQDIPHTEKWLDIIAYHYNFPREGSIIWNAMHGKKSQLTK